MAATDRRAGWRRCGLDVEAGSVEIRFGLHDERRSASRSRRSVDRGHARARRAPRARRRGSSWTSRAWETTRTGLRRRGRDDVRGGGHRNERPPGGGSRRVATIEAREVFACEPGDWRAARAGGHAADDRPRAPRPRRGGHRRLHDRCHPANGVAAAATDRRSVDEAADILKMVRRAGQLTTSVTTADVSQRALVTAMASARVHELARNCSVIAADADERGGVGRGGYYVIDALPGTAGLPGAVASLRPAAGRRARVTRADDAALRTRDDQGSAFTATQRLFGAWPSVEIDDGNHSDCACEVRCSAAGARSRCCTSRSGARRRCG